MTKPEFKLLPCVFCTIGFNCYVVGHKIVSSAYQTFDNKKSQQTKPELIHPQKTTAPVKPS